MGCHMSFGSAVERGLVRHCKSYSSRFLGPELIIQLDRFVFVSWAPWRSSATLNLGITNGHDREDRASKAGKR